MTWFERGGGGGVLGEGRSSCGLEEECGNIELQLWFVVGGGRGGLPPTHLDPTVSCCSGNWLKTQFI